MFPKTECESSCRKTERISVFIFSNVMPLKISDGLSDCFVCLSVRLAAIGIPFLNLLVLCGDFVKLVFCHFGAKSSVADSRKPASANRLTIFLNRGSGVWTKSEKYHRPPTGIFNSGRPLKSFSVSVYRANANTVSICRSSVTTRTTACSGKIQQSPKWELCRHT